MHREFPRTAETCFDCLFFFFFEAHPKDIVHRALSVLGNGGQLES